MDAVNVVSIILELRVPDIGDLKDVPVIEVLVKAGDNDAADRLSAGGYSSLPSEPRSSPGRRSTTDERR
jgi:hypothetical protein